MKGFFYLYDILSARGSSLNRSSLQLSSSFPDVITCLPSGDIQVAGAKAWILQAENSQLVFFEFAAGTKVPEHSHGYSQWGMVINGKMVLTVADKPRVCVKGSEYIIPAGAKHSAKFLRKTRVMDYFSEKSRYKPKTA